MCMFYVCAAVYLSDIYPPCMQSYIQAFQAYLRTIHSVSTVMLTQHLLQNHFSL